MMFYKIAIPARYENVPALREFCGHIAELNEFDKKTSSRIRLITDEVCSNAIEHGSQPTSEVNLQIKANKNQFELECIDLGHGNKHSAEEIKKSLIQEPAPHQMRGRGINKIIKGFADSFTIEDHSNGGIIVTVCIKNNQ